MTKHILILILFIPVIFLTPAFAVELEDETLNMEEFYLPDIQHNEQSRYVTGGVGEEEFEALMSVRDQYNLYLLNARASGAYVGDAHLVITDTQGAQVLSSDMGPVFLARLAPGTYILTAISEGQEIKHRIKLGEKPSPRLVMGWK